jgi:hypothetical protein
VDTPHAVDPAEAHNARYATDNTALALFFVIQHVRCDGEGGQNVR